MEDKNKKSNEVLEGELVNNNSENNGTDYSFVIAIVGLLVALFFNVLLGTACAVIAIVLNIRNRKQNVHSKNKNVVLIITISTIVLSIATLVYNFYFKDTTVTANYDCYNNEDKVVAVMILKDEDKFEWIDSEDSDNNFVKGKYSTSEKDVKYNGSYTLTFEGDEIVVDGEKVEDEEYKVNYSVIKKDLDTSITLIDNETTDVYYCKVQK